MHEARGQFSASHKHKTRHGGARLNPCTHEVESGRSDLPSDKQGVEGQPGLYEMVSQNNHDNDNNNKHFLLCLTTSSHTGEKLSNYNFHL